MDALNRFFQWVISLFHLPVEATPPAEVADTWLGVCEPMVKHWEGCELTAYPDTISDPPVWTVGYGATGPHIGKGTVWTQAQADADLRARLSVIGQEIDENSSVHLTDNQKAALADFAYNEGITALNHSRIYEHLAARDVKAAMSELELYDKADGARVQGLDNRRAAEVELFMS